MKISLVPVFPGTNCDKETLLWLNDNLVTNTEFLDLAKHAALTAQDIDVVVIPGGFSYGDYLRAGAIAARSKEMDFIARLATQGVPILGICNGFQVLCESKLLPGTLVKNTTRRHHHFPVSLKIDQDFLNSNAAKSSVWLPKLEQNKLAQVMTIYSNFDIPMSCGMGNWRPPLDELLCTQAEKNAVMYYNLNENGSHKSIAGIINSAGNVLGLMPHPERASDAILGSQEGLLFLYGVAQHKNIAIKPQSELAKFAKIFS